MSSEGSTLPFSTNLRLHVDDRDQMSALREDEQRTLIERSIRPINNEPYSSSSMCNGVVESLSTCESSSVLKREHADYIILDIGNAADVVCINDISTFDQCDIEYEKEHNNDSTNAQRDAFLPPEKYFYTTECPELDHLRSLSMGNRWTENEFVVWDDIDDVDKLSHDELEFYKFIFVFLGAADDLVNDNLDSLQTIFHQRDILHYYIEQQSIETVHARVYSAVQLMLFKNNQVARAEYVRECVRDSAILAKIGWLNSKVRECKTITEKFILMLLIEGLYFSSSFAAIAHLRTNNLFTVTCQLNTLISRDEAIHSTASAIIYNKYLPEHPKPSARRIHSLFKEAVTIEVEFLKKKAPKNGSILNLPAIYSYIRFTADRLLAMIHMPSLYDEPKPAHDFPMNLMFTADNTNFFERRNTAYSGYVTNDL